MTKLVYSPLGQDLALPLKQEGDPMFSVDLLLAAPRREVLRVLALTRPIDVFFVHASVDEATGRARRRAVAGRPVLAGRPALAVAT